MKTSVCVNNFASVLQIRKLTRLTATSMCLSMCAEVMVCQVNLRWKTRYFGGHVVEVLIYAFVAC